MVAIKEEVPLFVAVYEGILPVPLVPKPTSMVLAHVKVAPAVALVKLIPVPDAPLQ